MAVFKCKMCGGDLQVDLGKTIGVCDYCGTQQTFPRLSDDKRAQMYDRANHFRRNNDYDKAAGIFEAILNEDTTDSEAYWSLVLCKYGVEYVEDPKTKKRIPTCNRTQLTSILADQDYKEAIANADSNQRALYEEEARAIDKIQRGILEISNREEPFDVFICYKETDEHGKRSRESVIAQELYQELSREGFKVFFARITLENVLGTAYEPYIFAALNSSKVMVVVGTRPENFNAVWVKNEWSRYLALIRTGAKKVLIPAYRDMDAYDLPEEFSHLQAQDMGKLGFMQDLIRGIKKITGADTPTHSERAAANTPPSAGAGTDALLKRAYIFLEDGEFNQASEYFNRVLDSDPENARAYVGLLCTDVKVRSEEDLVNSDSQLKGNANYKNALRFSDNSLKSALQGYEAAITDRIETQRRKKEEQETAIRLEEEKRLRLEAEKLEAEEQERIRQESAELDHYKAKLQIVDKWRKIRLIAALLVYPGYGIAIAFQSAFLGWLSVAGVIAFIVSFFVPMKAKKEISAMYGSVKAFKKRLRTGILQPPPTPAAALWKRLLFALANGFLLFTPCIIYYRHRAMYSEDAVWMSFAFLGSLAIIVLTVLLLKKAFKWKNIAVILVCDFTWIALALSMIRGAHQGLLYSIIVYSINVILLIIFFRRQKERSGGGVTVSPAQMAVPDIADGKLPSDVSENEIAAPQTWICDSCGSEALCSETRCTKCGAENNTVSSF